MGSDASDGRDLQGVLIPHPDMEYWAAESSAVEEASPYPGEVVADRDTRCILSASGTPVNSDTIDIKCYEGGVTGSGGAGFVWRVGAEDYRGWDPPYTLAHWECIADQDTPTRGYRNPSVVVADSGEMVIAYDRPTTNSAGSGARAVYVGLRNATTGAWRNANQTGGSGLILAEISDAADANNMLHPSILVRPDGVLELYHLSHRDSATESQVYKWSSSDDGETWDLESSTCLDANLSRSTNDLLNLSVAYGNGQWLMAIYEDDGTLHVYGSRDGVHFEDQGEDAIGGYVACAYNPVWGRFVLVTIDTGNVLELRVGGSPFDASLLSDGDNVTTSYAGAGPVGVTVDESGTVWILAESAATHWTLYSQQVPGGSYYAYNNIQDGGQLLFEDFDLTWYRGQMIIASDNGETGIPASVCVGWYGGWTSITLPNVATGVPPAWGDSTKWDHTWAPVEEIDDDGTYSNAASSGSPTITVDGDFMNCSGTIGGQADYRTTPTGATGEAVRFKIQVRINDSDSQARIFAYASDGTNRYGVEARLTGGASVDTIDFRDVINDSSIGTDTYTAASVVEVLVEVQSGSGEGACWYRVVDPAAPEDRLWTHVGASSSLVQASNSTHVIAIRAEDTGGSYDVDVGPAQYKILGEPSILSTVSAGVSSVDNDDPTQLRSRQISTAPVYVHDGLSVAAAGLARGGDSWTITPSHTYEVEQMLPSQQPSPSHGWRSTTTAGMTLAFRVDDYDDADWGSPLIGVLVAEHNIHELDIQIYQSNSWSSTLPVSADKVTGFEDLAFTRHGETLVPGGLAGSSDQYFRRNDLAGGWVTFGTNTTKDKRTIARNGEGAWSSGTYDEMRAHIVCSDMDDTEASTGNGVNGITIVPRWTLYVLHLESGSQRIEGIRLVISADDDNEAPQGYWEIGALYCGPIHVLGWRPDNSRSRVLDLGERIEYNPDGTSYTHRERADRRRYEIAWTRPSPAWGRTDAGNSIDYVISSDNLSTPLPVATRYEGPSSFRGLLQQVGRGPVVYIPAIFPDASGEQYVWRACNADYIFPSRFVPQTFREETVIGAPTEAGELIRSSVVTLEEII